MKVFRPGFKPQYHDEPEPLPLPKPVGPSPEELAKTANAQTDATGLRQDGPTLKEYLDAGYDPKNYPPTGYASREPDILGPQPTQLIPTVKPLPLVDNNKVPGDPPERLTPAEAARVEAAIAAANEQQAPAPVDPLLK